MTSIAPAWLIDEPASGKVLDELRVAVGPLPESYLDLLQQGNGGEVGLRGHPFTLCLDSAEFALDYWRSGTCTVDHVFVFGGNGGGTLLAFDLRSPERLPVICFDPVDPESSMAVLAADFSGLLALCAS
jgi:hypothetical protein